MPRRPHLPPPRPLPPPPLPEVRLAGEAPRHVVAAHVRAERWVRVGRGAYVPAPDRALDQHAARRHLDLARIAAARRRLSASFVVSHASAAVLWGLPLHLPPDAVHVIQRWSPNNDVSRDVVRHVSRLADDEVTERAGIAVTTLERTAVDCAMLLGPAGGLVVMDAALHHGADRERCAELIARRGRARGVRCARAVLTVADDGAETAGESLLRLSVLRLGLVPPTTQVRVETALGIFWPDMGWEEWGVLAEYDGVAKYGASGPATASVLREKRRDRAIEDAGYRVLHFDKHDVLRPAVIEPRLRRVLPAAAFTSDVPRDLHS